jgi:hypothetical protein
MTSTDESKSKREESKQEIDKKILTPLSISSILRYTWGSTMNLSSQKEQRDFGSIYKDIFRSYVETEGGDDDERGNNETKLDDHARSFLKEVSLVISSVHRSYGFEREVFIDNINAARTLWDHQIAYYLNIAKSELFKTNSDDDNESKVVSTGKFNNNFNKLISFLGGGGAGLGLILNAFGPPDADTLREANTHLTEISKTLNDTSNVDILRNLTSINENLSGLSQWWSNDMLITIATFMVTGVIGYALYTFFANRYAYNKIIKIDMEKNVAYQSFWERQMKPHTIEMLMNLTKELRKILNKYYGIQDDGSVPIEEEQLRKYIKDEILPDDKSYIYRSKVF